MFSFCFLVHNEGEGYLSSLFNSMITACRPDEEIIICDDNSTEETTCQFLDRIKATGDPRVKFCSHALNNDFAKHKNFLISQCVNDYIFLMDADESLTVKQYDAIREFVITHRDNDMFALHRTNLLTDIKWNDYDILKVFNPYKNKIVDKNTVQVVTDCYQYRIWKNNMGIHYQNAVHETQVGFKKPIHIPETIASIMHKKTCARQRAQADFYKHFT